MTQLECKASLCGEGVWIYEVLLSRHVVCLEMLSRICVSEMLLNFLHICQHNVFN